MSAQKLFVGGYYLYLEPYEKDFSAFLSSIAVIKNKHVRCVVVVGDRDSESFRNSEAYRKLGEALASANPDALCCFGKDIRLAGQAAQRAGFQNVSYAVTSQELTSWLRKNVRPGDAAILGGGHSGSDLLTAVDKAYGTSYAINMLDQKKRYVSVHAKFRFAEDSAEFYRNEVCSEDEVAIPDTIGGLAITRVSANAFSRCREITHVSIPDTVVNIGSAAFYICPQLKTVALPKHLKVIENSAFNYCPSLATMDLPDGLLHIGRRAFYDCRNLRSVYVPGSVGFIGEEAFGNCPNVTVSVKKGSYAETYCRENKIPFRIV